MLYVDRLFEKNVEICEKTPRDGVLEDHSRQSE